MHFQFFNPNKKINACVFLMYDHYRFIVTYILFIFTKNNNLHITYKITDPII
jgi:hypothetical protein